MSSSNSSYHEDLLHWIWKEQHFEFRQLQTSNGKSVQVHDPGRANKSDGPDFSGAEISIGSLKWHGDVELHWKLPNWKAHGHHSDPNFNNVILHVVFEKTSKHSIRKDGTPIPTLCLSNYVSKPLQSFLEQYHQQPTLPCAGKFSFISERAFAKQLEQAHKEYFEQKVDDLLEFYDPSLPPSEAWRKMFTIAFCDGLGISHNREQMQMLAVKLIDQFSQISSKNAFREQALVLSGIRQQNSSLGINWNHKGCRPGNQPNARVQQASEALWFIYRLPFENWMHNDPETVWENLLASITTNPSLGRERASILFGTVFLPALYSLGNLFYSDKLKSSSWALWKNHQARIPRSLLTLLNKTDIPTSLYAQKLGSIYQLRAYCRPRKCQDCQVFKNAISS